MRRTGIALIRLLPFLMLPGFLAACQTAAPRSRLGRVATWAMQLQELGREGAVDRLAAAPVDMVVIEPTRTIRSMEDFPTRNIVARLKKDKLCLAYINVGQAEDYRTYWRASWRAPEKGRSGHPSYIVTVDPEGWEGNFPVAFWDPRWKAVLWGSSRALVDMAIADGFDGVYLDWVLGYREPAVAALHADPAGAMRDLIRDLRSYARVRRPGFLIIAQNGAALPGLAAVVDGFAAECLSFSGKAGADWDDAGAGDIAAADREERAALAAALKVPVFVIDYALLPENAEAAIAYARGRGFVPFVSRVSLDRLPSGAR